MTEKHFTHLLKTAKIVSMTLAVITFESIKDGPVKCLSFDMNESPDIAEQFYYMLITIGQVEWATFDVIDFESSTIDRIRERRN